MCVGSSSNRDVDADAVADAHGRFNVWAANLGAFQPPQSSKSLDFRLKDAEVMRGSVVSALERLSGVQGRSELPLPSHLSSGPNIYLVLPT